MNLKKLLSISAVMPFVALVTVACSVSEPKPTTPTATPTRGGISSNSLDQDFVFKEKFNNGSTISPHLSWTPIANAKSYAIVMVDKDAFAETGAGFFHWVVGGIDGTKTSLEENETATLPGVVRFENSGSKSIADATDSNKNTSIVPQNKQNNSASGYVGPFSDNADPHLYEIRVIGLNENVFESMDKNQKHYFPDFEKAIAGKVVGSRVLFAASAKPDTSLFFKGVPTMITNIKVDGDLGIDEKYFATTDDQGNYKYNDQNKSPEISFNKVEGAKSYVVMLNNSNQVKKWGVPLNNWNVMGIAQPAADVATVTIAKNATGTEGLLEGINSYYSGNPKSIIPTSLTSKTAALQNGFGLVNVPNVTDEDGFYTLFIYATDLEPSAFTKQMNQGDILRKMRNHIIGYGQQPMKIKKAATTPTPPATNNAS